MTAPKALVLGRGRFLLTCVGVPSDLARSGILFRWTVTDFDAGLDYEGLADSEDSASAEALTFVFEAPAVGDE